MSRLERALEAGRFLVTAELLSVDGGGLDQVHELFAPYEEWVDAVNATDNTAAHAHASPLAVAIALKQLGMEPVMQLVCRDRNRLALQADLAGAALHGIENVCCLTGDDVTAGDEPEARRVFDLDSIQLVAVAEAMRNGRYLSGRKLSPPPHLVIGAVENPQAPPVDYRVDRAWKKVRAGARFLQLQVVFELEPLARFLGQAVATGLAERAAILPSICLVRSPKALRFIDEKVPGISVPAGVIERCERAADPEAECFEVACELADAARLLPGVRGLHLISFRKEAGIARLCRRLGIPTREERESVGNGSRVAV
ncbi:MAG TPA: methylenetetrahydrofolate reductase [Gaiellaceae bacterium]|jgi:methylenetetrahydrofolate reductase (NADPH)|nr:methylenetetrahydrofolate reductase [Gaiellaceae bacterium]